MPSDREEGVCSSRLFEIIEGINKVLKLLSLKNVQGISFCLINHVDQNEFFFLETVSHMQSAKTLSHSLSGLFKKLNSTGEIKPLECYFALLLTKIKRSNEHHQKTPERQNWQLKYKRILF